MNHVLLLLFAHSTVWLSFFAFRAFPFSHSTVYLSFFLFFFCIPPSSYIVKDTLILTLQTTISKKPYGSLVCRSAAFPCSAYSRVSCAFAHAGQTQWWCDVLQSHHHNRISIRNTVS